VVCGGAATADIPGRYFEPTIILNPPKSSRVLTEEMSGL
jgi:acyl-CoA reductase-like NAD-dependent aldehyde dehydrogenase